MTSSKFLPQCIISFITAILSFISISIYADPAIPSEPIILNGDLSVWENERLSNWNYVPFSTLEIKKSQELYEGHAVIDVFHPTLGFLEQEYVQGKQLRAGDLLSASVIVKSTEEDSVDLSFLLEYQKNGETKRKHKTAKYTAIGKWQKIETLWKVKAEDLESLAKVIIHLRVSNLEKPVQVCNFNVWTINPGLVKKEGRISETDLMPALSMFPVEVLCLRP